MFVNSCEDYRALLISFASQTWYQIWSFISTFSLKVCPELVFAFSSSIQVRAHYTMALLEIGAKEARVKCHNDSLST